MAVSISRFLRCTSNLKYINLHSRKTSAFISSPSHQQLRSHRLVKLIEIRKNMVTYTISRSKFNILNYQSSYSMYLVVNPVAQIITNNRYVYPMTLFLQKIPQVGKKGQIRSYLELLLLITLQNLLIQVRRKKKQPR